MRDGKVWNLKDARILSHLDYPAVGPPHHEVFTIGGAESDVGASGKIL